MLCSINIFNPLPIKWNLFYTKTRKRQFKIKRAFEALQEVNEKFRSEPKPVTENISSKKSMFMTAFDFEYLRNKY